MKLAPIFLLSLYASTTAHAATLTFFCNGQNGKGEQVRFVETFEGKLGYEKMVPDGDQPPYPYVEIARYEMDERFLGPDQIEITGRHVVFTTGISGSVKLEAKKTGARDSRTFYVGKATVIPTVSTVRPQIADEFPISCQTSK